MMLRLWSACAVLFTFVSVSAGAGAAPRTGTVRDPDCDWAWQHMEVASAQEMLRAERGQAPGEGITIAHIDTGIIPIPALQNSANTADGISGLQWNFNQLMPEATFNWVQPHLPPVDNDPKALNFAHGTETASLLVGLRTQRKATQREKYFQGLVPWAKLIPIKVTDSVVMVGNVSTGGSADLRHLADGIRLASALGVEVMTISLGAVFDKNHLIEKAVAEALEQGIIVVAAGGQALPIDVIPLPASLTGVIGVTASTRAQTHWSAAFSGRNIAWAAPGENVCHLGVQRVGSSSATQANPTFIAQASAPFDQDGSLKSSHDAQQLSLVGRRGETIVLKEVLKQSSGTSYSTAYTAGAAALWLQHHGADDLKRRYGQKNISTLFRETALRWAIDTPSGWNVTRHGAGILNIRKLLAAPLPCRSEDSPATCVVKTKRFLGTASR